MSVTPPAGSVINLYLQIAILAAVLIGVILVKRRAHNIHEKIMALVIVMILISLVFWMGFSLLENLGTLVESPLAAGSLITIAHVIFGTFALALTVQIVYFRLKAGSLIMYRTKSRKNLMRIVFTLYLITFLLGISFYLSYFVF